ncbi:MAG: VOC family protein [Brevundimonas sp.]|uniref:VOC family protein n=1 Tax=Brevundimonas sp. TaxID=1871086 RepID=UPI00391DD4F3
MSTELGYFTIDTPDIDRARAFYGALFGWTFDEASSHETYAHVADAGVPFGFVKGERRDFSHLYFQVEDIDAVCARVTDLGGQCAVPADSRSGKSVTASDDQGVSFGLWQPAADL